MWLLLREEAKEQRANNARNATGLDIIRIVVLSLRWLDRYVGLY